MLKVRVQYSAIHMIFANIILGLLLWENNFIVVYLLISNHASSLTNQYSGGWTRLTIQWMVNLPKKKSTYVHMYMYMYLGNIKNCLAYI